MSTVVFIEFGRVFTFKLVVSIEFGRVFTVKLVVSIEFGRCLYVRQVEVLPTSGVNRTFVRKMAVSLRSLKFL